MRTRSIVIVIILLAIAVILAIILYRTFVRQVPCGPDLFTDLNGSFEDGNFQPGTDGSMNLPNGSTDLATWTVRVNAASQNPLRWSDNTTGILKTPFGHRFLNLAGCCNPPREPFPAVAQESIQLQPGRYQLSFALGQDRANGFPGPVSADVNISGLVSRRETRTTAANGDNWQTFAVEFEVNQSGSIFVSFVATAGQGAHFVRYIGLDNVSLRQFRPLFRCP
jgi:hypothetical protein